MTVFDCETEPVLTGVGGGAAVVLFVTGAAVLLFGTGATVVALERTGEAERKLRARCGVRRGLLG